MKAEKESTPKTAENKKKQTQAEVSPLYQRQAENSYSQTESFNKSNTHTGIPAVHSSHSTYGEGSALTYKKLQGSLANTGDLNHPETKQKERDYKDTLSIPELRNYYGATSSNTILNNPLEQSLTDLGTQKEEKEDPDHSNKLVKTSGPDIEKQNQTPITRLITIKKGQRFNNTLIQNQDDLNRFAESEMGITRPLNWTKVFSDTSVQKIVANGGFVRYTINIEANDIQKEINTLSTDKRHFIKSDSSTDYIQNLRILDLLKQLSDEEIIDYQNKVSTQSNNPAIIEASLKAYIDLLKQKRKEQDKLESVKTKLFGLEDIYKRYVDFSKSSPSITHTSSTGIPITIVNEGYEPEKKLLTEDLIANGFEGGIPEFKTFIERYEAGFENKTAQIGIDYLKQYKHFLYVEQEKLKDEVYLESLLSKLKSSGAKQKFDKANDAENSVSNLNIAEKPYSPQENTFKNKMKADANQKVSEAENNIKDFKTLTPLAIDEGFNSEGFAQCIDTAQIKVFLQNYITSKNQMANNAINKIEKNPEHIYELDTLFTMAKQVEQVQENSIYDSILKAKYNEIHKYDVLKAVGLGILSLAIIIVTWGAATPVVIAGGILSTGISIGLAYEAIEEYKTKKDFHEVGLLSDDPSMAWVVLAIAGAALDAVALAAVLKSARPIAAAAKTFNGAEDTAKALTKLENDLAKIEGLNDKLQQNIVKQARLSVEFRNAAQDFLHAGTTINSGINPAALPELIRLAEIGIQQGILSFKNFLLELELLKVIKSVDNLSSEELKILKNAFTKAGSGEKLAGKIEGLYREIEPKYVPKGFNFIDSEKTAYNLNGIQTIIEQGSNKGYFIRLYDPNTKTLVFHHGFLETLPKWIDDVKIPLVDGKGIPTQTYATLRQMKLMQIANGSLENVAMKQIQNLETMCYIAAKIEAKIINNLDEAGKVLNEAPSMQYVKTTIQQAGYDLGKISILRTDDTLIYTAKKLKSFGFEITEDLLKKHNLSWESKIPLNFDINIKLQTIE